MAPKTRLVSVLVETEDSWGRNIVESVCRFAHDAGWNLLITPRDHQGRLRIPKVWKGDGVVAALRNRSAAEHVKRFQIPVVDVSRTMNKESWFARVTTDDRQRAKLAFDHLRSRGLENFACYTPSIGRYSDHRAREFQTIVEKNGFRCQRFRQSVDHDAWLTSYTAVGEWLAELPKPLGVFAGDPYPARQLVEICSVKSIRIPDEVALISGDDDELLCNVATPSISSVELASHQIGETAAEILDRAMAGRDVTKEVVEIVPLGIRHRASTNLMAIEDTDLAAALRFIRDNACDGIGVADIVKACRLSRRTLENRFREILDRSPADEIRRIRFNRVRRLLIDTDKPIEAIALDCGFASGASLCQSYKQRYLESPGATRANTRPSTRKRKGP